MDVKDVSEGAAEVARKNSAPSQLLKRAADALRSSRIEIKDKVDVQSGSRRENNSIAQTRAKANEAISVVNLAEEATGEIQKLVASIGGIVDQVDNPRLSQQRREVLEREANQLVEEIRRKANVETFDGKKPLSGDPVRIEVDKRFAKTLDIILPDNAKEAFGLGQLRFSAKEAIVRTRDIVARAQEQLDVLKDAVKTSKDSIKDEVSALEVALQNSEAANVSIRDVDEALKLAGDTRIGIARDPQGALGSVGNIADSALQLLDER